MGVDQFKLEAVRTIIQLVESYFGIATVTADSQTPIETINILLVEDNPHDAQLIQEHLHSMNQHTIEIVHCTTLDSALQQLKSDQYDCDLILTDLSLADNHELKIVARILEITRDVPVIVLTNTDDQELALKAIRLGAQDFVSKKVLISSESVLLKIMRYTLERHQYQKLIELNRKRHARLLNNIPIGVFRATKDGRLHSVNYALMELLDTRKESDLIGVSLNDFLINKNSWKILLSQLNSVGLVRNLEVKIKSLDKGEAIGLLNAVVSIDEETGEHYIEGTISDVTLLKHTEKERLKMQQELRVAQRLEAVGTLASGIAHEINTPSQYIIDNLNFLIETTNSLLRYVNLVEQNTLQENNSLNKEEILLALLKAHRENDINYIKEELPLALKESLEGIQQIRKIVLAMKEFSHPGNGEDEEIDINKSVELSCTVCRNEWKHVAEIEKCLQPNLPSIKGATSHINMVITNLIINAAHALEEKQNTLNENELGQLGIIRIHTEKKGQSIILTIQDTGCGMPKEVIDNIFVPFYTTKEVGRGTGQGLHMVHRVVVETHGGSINVQSEEGVGSKFIVSLPINHDMSMRKVV